MTKRVESGSELPPTNGESSSDDLFERIVTGYIDLGRVEPISRNDFLIGTVTQMGENGLELTASRLSAIMSVGFGSKEQLREDVDRMTPEEFDRTYPDGIGVAVKWYITPPLPKDR